MDIVTIWRLNRVLAEVRGELERHGFFDHKLRRIEVRLAWFGLAFGWCYYGTSGDIRIPAVSFGRLWYVTGEQSYKSLPDVLRHEYGHALAHTHRGLVCSVPFKRAFGGHHDADIRHDYDPQRHVTEYAALSPSEDFAETFMLYLRHDGELPERFDTWRIRRKWRFIRDLGVAVSRGQWRWKPKSGSLASA